MREKPSEEDEKEIKFRAIIPNKNFVRIFTLCDLLDNRFSNREILWPWLRAGNKPDKYIDKKDKNNKEIYEGDILNRCVDIGYCESVKIGVVIYDKKNAYFTIDMLKHGFDISFQQVYSSAFEVIGNRHQNPELLT